MELQIPVQSFHFQLKKNVFLSGRYRIGIKFVNNPKMEFINLESKK